VNGTQDKPTSRAASCGRPSKNLAGDVGMYWQVGANGPSARVRYQILSQSRTGLDLSAGARFKTVVSMPIRARSNSSCWRAVDSATSSWCSRGVRLRDGRRERQGRRAKAFAGYRFSEDLRAGLDGRIQVEVGEEGTPGPGALPKTGRDYDFTAGPALSWIVARNLGTLFRNFQVQGLIGVAQPKRTDRPPRSASSLPASTSSDDGRRRVRVGPSLMHAPLRPEASAAPRSGA